MTSKPDRVLSAEALGEGRALLEQATPDPWTWGGSDAEYPQPHVVDMGPKRDGYATFMAIRSNTGVVHSDGPRSEVVADAALIVWLKANAPALLDAAESVEKINPEFIAAVIRRVDGNNLMGAGQLGDLITEALKGQQT